MLKRYYNIFEQGLDQRPKFNLDGILSTVDEVLKNVRENGDKSLFDYCLRFDKAELTSLKVTEEEIEVAKKEVPNDLKVALKEAYGNIEAFHRAQKHSNLEMEVQKGVLLGRKAVPIETVGLYIPGGSAPLFSTVLMLAIPAKVAGCKHVIMCTPCDSTGKVNSATLYAASISGVKDIYKVGGAQAIAAMAYGTETIPKCHKIFGPGNRYVMGAKMKVSSDTCSIDMPAGPSEVLVACDSSANPAFVAADLLSQGEHGPDSQTVMAFAGSKEEFEDFANKVDFQLDKQLSGLGRASIASKALENSFAVFGSREEVTAFINSYAPEHLILNLEEPMSIMDKVENAGSVFIGPWSCESAGDYASGTNHTLPTSLWAKSCSGVNTDSFMKHITYQTLSKEGLKNLGNTIMTMAYAEGLQGHGDAVKIRLKEDI